MSHCIPSATCPINAINSTTTVLSIQHQWECVVSNMYSTLYVCAYVRTYVDVRTINVLPVHFKRSSGGVA